MSGGTLKAGAANTLNATSAHSVNGTLDLNGFNNEIASLGGNGNVTNSGASAATLTMGGNNGSPTFSGAIQDGTSALGLIKTGSGTFTLSGANNTYTGGTTVNGGTFIQGVIGAFQRAFTVSNGATLDFGNFATTLSSLVANAGSSLINNTALTLTGDSTLNADLGGGSLTITGGTTNIGAAQSYTGDTVVSGGTLKAGAANALSASSAHTINATLDLNGFNSTIAALSGNGNLINSGGAPAALTFGSNNASTTFSGTIQDGTSAFGLIKTGSGTFTLSGANNTYTGGTTLSAGELRVDAANALGTGQVALEGGILKFGIDQNVTNTIQVNAASTINNTGKTVTLASGALSGSGDLVFAGTGLFSLSGDNGYAGDATITEGEVKLNGSIAGNFTVNEGATLSGNATIGGNLVNKGTLSPGNSVGKVIVNGNYTADATSVQKFEIDPQGNFDEITVLGNAQLGGKLLIVPAAGTYGTGTKYDFFKVSGTITGNFDSVESTLRLDYIFDTTSNSVSLTINKTSFKDLSKIAGISKNGDLVSFARYLDGVDEKADPNSDIMRVIGKLNQVTEVSKLRKSLLSLSALPTLHQTWSYTALQQGINAITRAQQARTHQNRWMSNLAKEGAKPQLVAQLAEVTSKPAPKFNPKALQNAAMHASDSASVVPVDRNVPMVQHHHNLTLWTTPWAHNYEQDRKKAVAKLKARIRGWAIGADVALSPNLTVGLMGQVARTKDRIGDCLAKDRINTKGTGFYGSWHEKDNGAFLDFAAGINGHRVKGSRRITIVDDHRKAHHKTRARTTDGNMTLGYDFVPATYWQVTPKLSQSLTHINQKHYREHGAGDINLKVRRKKGRMVATELSVDVAKTIKREKYLIRPMVSIGYGHRQMSKKLLRQTASFTGSSGSNFVVKGGRRKQNSLLMAAGLSTSNINGLGFAINAHREHAKKASSYGVTANLLWKY